MTFELLIDHNFNMNKLSLSSYSFHMDSFFLTKPSLTSSLRFKTVLL